MEVALFPLAAFNGYLEHINSEVQARPSRALTRGIREPPSQEETE